MTSDSGLPRSLDPSFLLDLPYPGDLTLAEALAAAEATAWFRELMRLSSGRARLRFLDRAGADLPGSTTVADLRRLARAGLATVAIDDGDGGLAVTA